MKVFEGIEMSTYNFRSVKRLERCLRELKVAPTTLPGSGPHSIQRLSHLREVPSMIKPA